MRRIRRLRQVEPVLKRTHHAGVCTDMPFLIAELGFIAATDLLAHAHVGFGGANRRFLHTSRALVRANRVCVGSRARDCRLR